MRSIGDTDRIIINMSEVARLQANIVPVQN